MSNRTHVPDPGQARLAAVLAAAHAPTHDGEWAGEEAAMLAFRTRAEVAPAGRRRVLRRLAAICAVVLATSGVAVAATAGTLPDRLNPFVTVAHSDRPAAAKPTCKPPGCTRAYPDLAGQCRRWHGLPHERRRSALDQPEYRDLTDRAGSRDADRVERFCEPYVPLGPQPSATGGSPGPQPYAQPQPSGSPRPEPSGSWSSQPLPPGPDDPRQPTGQWGDR